MTTPQGEPSPHIRELSEKPDNFEARVAAHISATPLDQGVHRAVDAIVDEGIRARLAPHVLRDYMKNNGRVRAQLAADVAAVIDRHFQDRPAALPQRISKEAVITALRSVFDYFSQKLRDGSFYDHMLSVHALYGHDPEIRAMFLSRKFQLAISAAFLRFSSARLDMTLRTRMQNEDIRGPYLASFARAIVGVPLPQYRSLRCEAVGNITDLLQSGLPADELARAFETESALENLRQEAAKAVMAQAILSSSRRVFPPLSDFIREILNEAEEAAAAQKQKEIELLEASFHDLESPQGGAAPRSPLALLAILYSNISNPRFHEDKDGYFRQYASRLSPEQLNVRYYWEAGQLGPAFAPLPQQE